LAQRRLRERERDDRKKQFHTGSSSRIFLVLRQESLAFRP
jgi:hypothetical protein